jgi:signal transduction histidine kinase
VNWEVFRFRQILSNFLSNALKFTDAQGKVTVKCQVITESESGGESGYQIPEKFVLFLFFRCFLFFN